VSACEERHLGIEGRRKRGGEREGKRDCVRNGTLTSREGERGGEREREREIV